jgi:hypothetical protein
MHVFGNRIRAFVQVEAKNRAAQRPHGQLAAVVVEVDFTTPGPAFAERLRRA